MNLERKLLDGAILNGYRPAPTKYNIAVSTIRVFIKSYMEEAPMDRKGPNTIPLKSVVGIKYKLLLEEIDHKNC